MRLSTTNRNQISFPPRSDLERLIYKYEDFEQRGFLILAVTLATGVRSDRIAESERFSSLWTKHFLEKVQKRIPKRVNAAALDHDYTIECSDTYYLNSATERWVVKVPGCWHFHGLLAVHPGLANRYWLNGRLNHHLFNDLMSFRSRGKYRPFRITSFLIEPTRSIEDWIRYINKRRQQKVSVL